MAKKFVYKGRTKDSVKKRAEQSAGLFDPIFHDQFTSWTPKTGDRRLRILPPTWDDPEHFGFDIYVHYGIGSDGKGSYLCASKMKNEPCPVCEERRRAEKAGDADYASDLAPTKRVVYWIIDRDNESDGPILYAAPWTIDRDISKLSLDKRSGEILNVDDPVDGYDIEFSRDGAGIKTKYVGIQVARKSTTLADDPDTVDEWLDFILENPIPTTFQFFSYERISEVFNGADDEKKPAPAAADDEPPFDADEKPKEEEKPKEKMERKNARRRLTGDEKEKTKEVPDDDDDDAPAPKAASGSIADRIRQRLKERMGE